MGQGMGINSVNGVNTRFLQVAQDKQQDSLAKLAEGLRIRRASDDASGLGTSERLRSQIRSLDQASRNTLAGVDLVKTADSALGQGSELLSRMRELSVRSSSGTLADADRAQLNEEFGQLSAQLDQLGQDTEFNGQALLDGSTSSVSIQTGASAAEEITIEMAELSANALAIDGEAIDSAAGAASALAALDGAITEVSGARGDLGASLGSLSSSHANSRQASVQLSSSESRIRDVDVALETALAAKQQVLAKGAIALLSQSELSASRAGRLI